MNDKVSKAQSEIEGTIIAKMILDFRCEFRDVYGPHVLASSLCAVGPLQSLIGLAIRNGILKDARHDQR